MAEDLLLCFSTSKRGHCISFLVPFSILHCQSVPKHNPNTGLSCHRPLLSGRGSTNIFSILHFHCQPQPQRHSNNTSAAAGAADGDATPVHWRKPTLSTRILDPGELQRNLLHQGSSPFSIPLPEANQQQVHTVCSTGASPAEGTACGKKVHLLLDYRIRWDYIDTCGY